MNKSLPKIKFDIDEADPISGIKTMSLVDEPAIESDFIYFSKESSQYVELKSDNYKQVVAGLALIPNKYILRVDPMGNQYYGYFTPELVEKLRNKFHKEQMTSNVNTDHNQENYVNGFLIESFIIDSIERLNDVKSKGIKEAILGSWYVSYKIEDKATFDRVVSGELKGFSVEAFLQQLHKQEDNNIINEFEKTMVNIIQKFKDLLSEMEADVKEEVKLERAIDADGKTIDYGVEGEPVNIISVGDDGSESTEVAPDKDYVLDNGYTITVKDGVLAAIAETVVEEEQEKVDDSELEKELATVKAEKEGLEKEIEKLKAEVLKLKKAPVVKPTSKKDVKVEEIDFTKLSNADKFLAKHGLLN